MPTTWIRKNRQIYKHSDCLLCGTAYGICKGEPMVHKPSVCKACGTPQCWTNGLAHGSCSVCYVGILDAFSGHDKPCGYAHCQNEAVAFAPRVGRVCLSHLGKAKLSEKIAQALAERDKFWEKREFTYEEFPKR